VNCNPIARWYRWLEYMAFGRALERRRFAFLRDVADTQRALVLGDGDGRFLARLVKQNSNVRIDYVDLSEKMLALARGRTGTQHVSYWHADARTTPFAAAEYDLIVTHFFFDCLSEDDAGALVARLAAAVRPGARWIVSEFREPAWWAHVIVSGLYLVFRIATGLKTRRLFDHRPLLARNGFQLMKEEQSYFGLLASELWVARST
jgi:ubiquinone/menaquinone biosynthesis C-methylase UbiE